MKRSYLTLLLSIFASASFAQFPLTSDNHVPAQGEEYLYYYSTDMSQTDIYNEGANQSWDLTTTPELSVPSIYTNPADEDEGSNFPDANLVENISQGGQDSQNYYKADADGYSLEGQFIEGQGRITYNDPREILQFPFEYGDTYNGTFSATVENLTNGQVFDRSGEIEVEVDGYGNLQTPDLNIENVVRVKAIYTYSDEYMGTPVFDYTDTLFIWYHQNTAAQVGSYTSFSTGGFTQLRRVTYIDPNEVNVSEFELANQNDISVYPNPASDQITFRNVKNEGQTASVYNSFGQIVMKVKLEEERSLDISNLEPGVYFITWHTGTTSQSEKLVVR
ncbi:T9SS type A sorting domain-containing protein [Halocola ammonii]